MGWPILSLLVWLPILAGIAVLALGSQRIDVGRPVALIASILVFIISIPLFTHFDMSTASMQFVERHHWIDSLSSYYYLGVDGISMPLILLTTFLTPLVVIAGWRVIKLRPAQYYASFLIMEGLMIGVFAALDALLFYVFWEAMLVPMFIIIGVWGGPRRVYATMKFFLYTFLGSVLMLVALIYLYRQAGTFDIQTLQALPLTMQQQVLIFFAFLVAFAVKVPMFPVHTWLPDAHVEAPTGGSVILAAVLLKMGGYGFVRFSLPIAPDASHSLSWLMIALSLIAIVYISAVALVQKDMKKLVAYSSVVHMGFVTLGFFVIFGAGVGAQLALQGGMFQMISHGLVSAALFLCIGVLYDRMHTREISAYGGVVNSMPKFAMFWVLFAFANIGLPGTSGFVGEFFVILGSYHASFWYSFFAASVLILGAAYTLWLVKRIIFGDVGNANVAKLPDINANEMIVLGTLAVAVIFIGVFPHPLVSAMDPSLHHLLTQVMQSKIG